jgi:hypothetical protein
VSGALERALGRAKNVRKTSDGYLVSCPVPGHGQGRGDENQSLSVSEDAHGNVGLHCFAGCSTEAVVDAMGLTMADLFERNGSRRGGGDTSTRSRSSDQPPLPATLHNYADYIGLPVTFLKEEVGLTEIRYQSNPAVRMPYLNHSSEDELLTRYRLSLTGKQKVKTKKGDKHRLYGLWKLAEARKAGYVWLVEGESDSQTLWFHEEPALGIPGANGWKAEWAPELEGIERIYFVVEDEAGEACWRKLAATPELRERLYRVDLEGVKDVSELHKGRSPEDFLKALREARERARAWMDIAESEQEERNREAFSLCRELAESPDILAELGEELKRQGLVGEERNAKLLYLALTSRLLEKIVSVVVKGPSSAGKNYLAKKVMALFPESAYWFFSGMSEKTLFYTEESLSHRHLVLSEATGVNGEFQDYIIRTLLSEGFLEYEFVEKGPEGLRPRRLRKEGPTGFVTTTTRASLHAENETRYLSLTVSDTPEQTRNVFLAIASEDDRADEANALETWRALQVWLEGSEHRVTVPYARWLAEKTANVAVRLRRDFSVIQSLVKAHALLHHATRERDPKGRIVATIADYTAVFNLVADLVSEGVEVIVPPIVRETVEAVQRLISRQRAKDSGEDSLWAEPPTIKIQSIADALGVDKAAASRRVAMAVNLGYLENLETRTGLPAKIVIGEPMPKNDEILPPPEKLEKEWRG